jgi:hypothetical protein
MGLLGLGRSGAQRRLLARFGRDGVRGQGTSRDLRPFLSARRHQVGLTAILQPVTLAANVDGRRVMQQPVQDRRCDNRIAEDRSPVSVAFVRGQNDAPTFISRSPAERKLSLLDRPAVDTPLGRSPELSAPGTRASGDPAVLPDTLAPGPLPDRAR